MNKAVADGIMITLLSAFERKCLLVVFVFSYPKIIAGFSWMQNTQIMDSNDHKAALRAGFAYFKRSQPSFSFLEDIKIACTNFANLYCLLSLLI